MHQKITVNIREGSWLARLAAKKLGAGKVALVIGHTIHLHHVSAADFLSRQSWVLHELKHVEQYERHGMLRFLWRYLADSAKNGYAQNSFELEARKAESETALLDKYELVLPGGKNKS